MATSGTWNITPAHGNRTVLTVTSVGFDFPGKNSIRYRIFDREGGRALITILETDTNGMTRASGTLTLTLDSNVATLPNLSAIWTTLGPRRYYHELEIRNSASEDYHKVFGGTITFQADGSAGTENASASFTYSDGATSTALTVALGDAKKHNYVASTAPGVTDDSAAGYSIGSRWFDNVADLAYDCVDATAGAAVWNTPSGIANVVEDTTPQLGGALDVNGKEITGAIDLHSTGDIIQELGDAAGSNKVSIRDSAAVEVAAVDSDGNITLAGTVDGRDVAADGTKLDGIESGADVTDATNVAAAGAGMLGTAQEWTATQNFNATTLTDAANIAWDASANQFASVTLAGNRTLDNPTNMKDGGTYILIVKQDGAGSRTLAYGAAYKWPGGTAPTLSTGASAVDILTFVSDGTSMFGVAQLNFS